MSAFLSSSRQEGFFLMEMPARGRNAQRPFAGPEKHRRLLVRLGAWRRATAARPRREGRTLPWPDRPAGAGRI